MPSHAIKCALYRKMDDSFYLSSNSSEYPDDSELSCACSSRYTASDEMNSSELESDDPSECELDDSRMLTDVESESSYADSRVIRIRIILKRR